MSSIFLFHRDLRLNDNTALIKLIKENPKQKVTCLFILDPVQIDRKQNEHFSNPAVQFMCESLEDLDKKLKSLGSRLTIIKGDTVRVLKGLNISTIAWNEDISAFAKERDAKIIAWANKNNVRMLTATDYYLTEPNEGLGPSGPYKVLSAFWKWFLKAKPARKVDSFTFKSNHFTAAKAGTQIKLGDLYDILPDLAMHGGRTNGMKQLAHLSNLEEYATNRDFPANKNGSSHLSPYLKFGCISVREAYWAGHSLFGEEYPLLRQLVFRDFYAKIYSTDKDLQTGKKAVMDKLDKHLAWYTPHHATALWKAWTTGTTGFPLVDAGMRELLATGHQHNRVRMLCASVLTKYMWIDWRFGAQFYYTHLVDADIFSNTAGWGFSSSTGIDAVPYFRAPFNPFTQSKKFDPEAVYIKKWVPELADVPAKMIHNWAFSPHATLKYPAPVLDFQVASKQAVVRFKNAAAAAK